MGQKVFYPHIYEEIKFQNKYRIPSARAQWWDYGNNAAYFITICTANRKHHFGNIINGKMELSPIGIVADIFWHEIRKHADFVKLGEFVVMPNHIHGILIVDKSDNDGTTDMVVNPNTVTATVTVNTAAATVETGHALSLQNPNPNPNQRHHQQQWQHQQSTQSQSLSQPSTQLITKPQSNLPPQTRGQKRFQNQGKNTISSVIGGYKSAVTNHAHRLGHYFQWQPRFYDHIIKNNDEYQRIAKYITNNPVNWQNDKFNTV